MDYHSWGRVILGIIPRLLLHLVPVIAANITLFLFSLLDKLNRYFAVRGGFGKFRFLYLP